MYHNIIKNILFKLNPETAHHVATNLLKRYPNFLFPKIKEYKNLKNNIFGLNFKNPIGMAAGFDKNAEIFHKLFNFGFGFVECGTVTIKPQIGNTKPRLFRLKEDQAIINRMGFNNNGIEKFLTSVQKNQIRNKILGINIGKNKDANNDSSDYIELIKKSHQYCQYITINISSPNTKNLRNLQQKESLDQFIYDIQELKKKQNIKQPILLKIAPDLNYKQQEEISDIANKYLIDGLIISNSSISLKNSLKNKHKIETGGLSGQPIFNKSNLVIKNIYQMTKGNIPIIGVGGISNAKEAYEKIKLGASLIQIYTAFVYQGFSLVEKIKKDLSQMIKEDGFLSISNVIGLQNK